MYCKTLNLHISLVVTPMEALFLSLPPEFTGLHDGIKFFLLWRSYRKLLKKNGLPSERDPTSYRAFLAGIVFISLTMSRDL